MTQQMSQFPFSAMQCCVYSFFSSSLFRMFLFAYKSGHKCSQTSTAFEHKTACYSRMRPYCLTLSFSLQHFFFSWMVVCRKYGTIKQTSPKVLFGYLYLHFINETHIITLNKPLLWIRCVIVHFHCVSRARSHAFAWIICLYLFLFPSKCALQLYLIGAFS